MLPSGGRHLRLDAANVLRYNKMSSIECRPHAASTDLDVVPMRFTIRDGVFYSCFAMHVLCSSPVPQFGHEETTLKNDRKSLSAYVTRNRGHANPSQLG